LENNLISVEGARVGTYVKELWSCRSFSRVSCVFSEDVSDVKLTKKGYVCKRIAVVSQLQSRCNFFSPSRCSSLVVRSIAASSGRPGFKLQLASPEKESQHFSWVHRRREVKFRINAFQWKEGRKEGSANLGNFAWNARNPQVVSKRLSSGASW
jgi:hypothetical protein